MRRRLICILGIALLASCTGSEQFQPNEKEPAAASFLSVRIASVGESGTRADGEQFEDGSAAENAVANLLLLFYGEDKGLPVGLYKGDWTQTADTDPDNDIESRLEWGVSSVVPITKLHPGTPVYAVALLNYAADWENDLLEQPLNRIPELVKTDYAVQLSSGRYFLMTNSGRFDKNDTYHYASDIAGFVFQTEEEAAAADPAVIYVERAAARVDFKVAENASETYVVYHGSDAYDLSFSPSKWGLTATEKENFVVKNMQGSLSAYATEKGYARGFDDWISYNSRRTFWAETPRYGKYVYPASGLDEMLTEETPLNYVGEDDLSALATEGYSTAYTFEHTFPAADLTAANPFAVPTSIIFTGSYSAVRRSDATPLDFNDGGFYLRSIAGQNHIYLEQNAENKNELLNAMLGEQKVICYDSGSDDFMEAADADDFEIRNTGRIYNTDGTSVPASNAYTLQLKESAAGKYYLRTYVPASGGASAKYDYFPIGADGVTLEEANAALQKNVGFATFYGDAQAFFLIPVLHYITEDSYPGNKYTGTFAYDDEGTVINRTGEFGIVRNHIYRLTVEELGGLGFGATGTDIPLLPSPTEEQFFIKARIDILSWHMIEYDVELK